MKAIYGALAALVVTGAQAQTSPVPASDLDPLSLFGQDVSSAVDRAVDLSVYASLCGTGNVAAALVLRDAATRKVADCFRADSKAATWAADITTHFEGRRALLLDLVNKNGKDAVCGRLYESDGKTLSAYGREVVADGERYATSAASAPIAKRPCP
ncbi:hypothetical protein [Reyranella sp. CPCC 100927]|uniref:hypothetical protein n=1 Tax=Reyranella sp. CPCC 100927 TaxID=2599616 RepID=UPI0011B3FDA2|nr:hypothetical protein [Reyranella sp. CPCC 100927]TWS98458.1 hypothetical protein FQU96_35700 [Reyranella sp. CPCC 100927]